MIDVAGVVRPDDPEPSLPVEVALASAPEPVETPAGLGFGVPSPGQAPGE